MELRILRYFLTVVQEGSMTKAAEKLHITQPTLSRQIAQMEEELGVKLFARGARKLALTSEGLLLRRRAEEILELVDKTETELVAQDAMVAGVVSVGCGDLAAVQQLPALFRAFHAQYPAVTFDLYTATADHIQDRMDRGLTDLGLLLEPVNMEKYDYLRFPQPEQWVVAMHPESPLAQLTRVTPGDLLGTPLILPNRAMVQSELASWFGETFDRQDILFTANLPSTSSVLVHQKLACALLIRGSVSFWDPDCLTFRPLQPPLTATSVLAWKRKQPFGAAAERFIQFAKAAFHRKEG